MSDKVIVLTDAPTIKSPSLINRKFPYDNFQQHALNCIINGYNILVTAPTACGKTVVAEDAIINCLNKGKTVAYTSPIKALSNQIFKSMTENFKDWNLPYQIGLTTGDVKKNISAPFLIMTTEILCNSLYMFDNSKKNDLDIDFISNLGLVIFDEAHYIKDDNRGSVWESTISLLAPEIQIVLLSATFGEPIQFATWIAKIKNKPVYYIPVTKRVIPLEIYIYQNDECHLIMDKNNNYYAKNYGLQLTQYKIDSNKKYNNVNIALIDNCIKYLDDRLLLPAIFFSFSRKNCEKFALSITQNLVSHEERTEIIHRFDSYLRDNLETYSELAQYQTLRKLVEKGIAFHHSGVLPILKEAIEFLAADGLIKILFATETFAMGFNMPCKVVVLLESNKYTHKGRRNLLYEEVIQMFGRAGRRGLDLFGMGIFLPVYDLPDNLSMQKMLNSSPEPIKSKLLPDYHFVLKLILSNHYNINTYLQSTLYYRDTSETISYYKMNLIKEIDTIVECPVPIDTIEYSALVNYKKIIDIEQNLINNGFALSQKMKKNHQKIKQNTLKIIPNIDTIFHQFKQYLTFIENKNNLEHKITKADSFFDSTVENIIIALKKIKYLDFPDDFPIQKLNKNHVLIKGIMAATINECNPLILTEIITNSILSDLTSPEIAAVLAIFIDDSKNNEQVLLPSLKSSKNVINALGDIEKIIDNFIKFEQTIKLDFYLKNWYKISYDWVDIAFKWASNNTLNETLNNISTYEGNFVKNMLKIINIANDMIELCSMHNYLEIIPQLQEIEPLMKRGIVKTDSLYLQ